MFHYDVYAEDTVRILLFEKDKKILYRFTSPQSEFRGLVLSLHVPEGVAVGMSHFTGVMGLNHGGKHTAINPNHDLMYTVRMLSNLK